VSQTALLGGGTWTPKIPLRSSANVSDSEHFSAGEDGRQVVLMSSPTKIPYSVTRGPNWLQTS
jgi:hypothetical protein